MIKDENNTKSEENKTVNLRTCEKRKCDKVTKEGETRIERKKDVN